MEVAAAAKLAGQVGGQQLSRFASDGLGDGSMQRRAFVNLHCKAQSVDGGDERGSGNAGGDGRMRRRVGAGAGADGQVVGAVKGDGWAGMRDAGIDTTAAGGNEEATYIEK